MKRTARRLTALVGAAVLLVLALAAGPAAAAMLIQNSRGTGFITVTSTPAGGGSRVLVTLLSAVAIALVAGAALLIERRGNQRWAAAQTPAESAGRVCDDVVCEFQPSQAPAQERKAA